MTLAFMDEAFQHIREQLDKKGHEVIFKYDCRKHKWFVHIYPLNKWTNNATDRWIEEAEIDNAVMKLMNVFRDMKKGD